MPVSYTHLDVYKRQMLPSAIDWTLRLLIFPTLKDHTSFFVTNILSVCEYFFTIIYTYD